MRDYGRLRAYGIREQGLTTAALLIGKESHGHDS